MKNMYTFKYRCTYIYSFQPLILPEMHASKHRPGTFQRNVGPQRNITEKKEMLSQEIPVVVVSILEPNTLQHEKLKLRVLKIHFFVEF